MKVKEFKACFEDYIDYLKQEKALKEKIELLYYELSGVKGISYDKIPNSFNQEYSDEIKLELIDLINLKQAELRWLQAKYNYFTIVLSKLKQEDIMLLYRLLIKGQSYEKVGNELGFSSSGLFKYVERLIEGVI